MIDIDQLIAPLRLPIAFANTKNGAYFQYVGTYNTYLLTEDVRVIRNEMSLTHLEDTLKTAKRLSDHKYSAGVRLLEESLHKIFQIAHMNHNDFISTRFRPVPQNQLGKKIKDALYDAQYILNTLESLWKDSFEQLFSTTRYMFDRMNEKHLLTFRADMEFSKEDGSFLLTTRQLIPHFVRGDLYKVFYSTVKNDTNCFHASRIADQSVRYLMIIHKEQGLKEHIMKIRNLDDCDILSKTLLCDPQDGTFDEYSNQAKCLKALYKDYDDSDRYCEYTLPELSDINCLDDH